LGHWKLDSDADADVDAEWDRRCRRVHFTDPRPFCATDIMAENLFYGGNGVMFYAISRSKCLTLRRHRAGNGIAKRICPAEDGNGNGNGHSDGLTAACTIINVIQLRINSMD